MNRRILLAVILFAIAGFIYLLEQTKVQPDSLPSVVDVVTERAETVNITASASERIAAKAGKYPAAPELRGISGYLNANESLRIADLQSKVVLVDFWTFSCVNCIRTFPHLVEWDRKYREQGLVIIGVHTPEFAFEKDIENVREAVERHGIMYAVVQDNDYATWRAYNNRYWPRKYLIDQDGFIRYDHIGEGSYDETERMIRDLLAETGADVQNMPLSGVEDRTPRGPHSPELYAGYDFALPRGQNIGNAQGLVRDASVNYTLPIVMKGSTIYLGGVWKSNADHLAAESPGTELFLPYFSTAVNIVAEADEPVRVRVRLNGEVLSEDKAGDDVFYEDGEAYVHVSTPRLYNLVRGQYADHVLMLRFDRPGFRFNAFTFG